MARVTARFSSNAGRRRDLEESTLRKELVVEVGDNLRPGALIPDY